VVGNKQGIDIHVCRRIVGHQNDLLEEPGIDLQEAIHDALPTDADEGFVLSVESLLSPPARITPVQGTFIYHPSIIGSKRVRCCNGHCPIGMEHRKNRF
jgi:hypothetical protein